MYTNGYDNTHLPLTLQTALMKEPIVRDLVIDRGIK